MAPADSRHRHEIWLGVRFGTNAPRHFIAVAIGQTDVDLHFLVGDEDVRRGLQRRQRIAQLVSEHRQELVLAAAEVAHLELAPTSAQRRAQRGEQGSHAHRPLEHRIERFVTDRQNDERQVRPGRLMIEDVVHARQHRRAHGLLRQHDGARARLDLATQLLDVGDSLGRNV